MSSNQAVLDALEKEGIVTTEEALLRAVEDQTMPTVEFNDHGMLYLDEVAVSARPPLAESDVKASIPVKYGIPQGPTPIIYGEIKTEGQLAGSGSESGEPAHGTQSVWQKISALPGKGLCFLGIHPAPWVYLRERECEQLRDCQRCTTARTRVKHRRNWIYAGPKTCVKNNVCQRCNHKKGSRTDHQAWSNPWSVGQNEEAHRCLRCEEVVTYNTDCGD